MSTKVTKKETLSLINIIALVFVLVIIGLGGGLIKNYAESKKPQSQEVASAKVISYKGVEGKTVLELLQSRAAVETQDSSIGKFVVSIDGMTNTNESYWIYYVDGNFGDVSASEYKTKDGQQIEWRYEKLF